MKGYEIRMKEGWKILEARGVELFEAGGESVVGEKGG